MAETKKKSWSPKYFMIKCSTTLFKKFYIVCTNLKTLKQNKLTCNCVVDFPRRVQRSVAWFDFAGNSKS